MKQHFIFSIILLIESICVQGQLNDIKYYMPKAISDAYKDSTRSLSGKPGKNYWHNTVDYKIDVTIDPINYTIDGFETVKYYNNSPNDLNEILIRLYADVYKKGNARNSPLGKSDIHEGVKLQDLIINNDTIDLNNPRIAHYYNTNLSIKLKTPLKTNSELTLSTKWSQKIPVESPYRMGTYDSTNFFLAYWYPQISVYDDIMGWDRLDYGLRTEFYNNLANFDVNISAPDNYVVVATGTLANPDEIFPKQILKKYNAAKTSEDNIQILTLENLEKGFKTKSNKWHYVANEVSDFAISATDRYLWMGSSQAIGEKKVFISSIYPKTNTSNFDRHIEMQKKTMLHLSNDIPGIPYPYPAFTTFISGGWGGGMEFPMMANNGDDGRGVTIHEMYHTYMPMYVRTNERLWAWMDEGWAVYNTLMVENKFFNNKTKSTDFVNNGRYMWLMGEISDIPIMTPSEFTTHINYGYLSYAASATIITILQHYLGEELFLKCYCEFISRWAKKSPTPYDFFFTFEDVSGKDLSWFFNPWMFEFGYADVDIKSFEKGKLTIVKTGNKPVPLFVDIIYKNDSIKTHENTADIWKDGNNSFEILIPDYEEVKAIHVNKTIADMNKEQNDYPNFISIKQLVLNNIEELGVDSALNCYRSWLKKDPNIYTNHNYSNTNHLDKVIQELKDGKNLEAAAKVQFFVDSEFTPCKVRIVAKPKTLPKSGKIFITGQGRKFGNWNAGAVAMQKADDGTWFIELELKRHSKLRFKFTGGSWDSEFLDKNGKIANDITFQVKESTAIAYDIYKWEDE